MARDPLAPVDPGTTQDTSVDPSQTPSGTGVQDSDLDGGEYQYWLRDGVTPFRSSPDSTNFQAFSRDDDGWMLQNSLGLDSMHPSTAGEVAGMIPGGRTRLTEPFKGALPVYPGPDEDYRPVSTPDWLAEADSTEDTPASSLDGGDNEPPSGSAETAESSPDLPDGAMTEQQIRDAGLRIDVPWDTPMPVALKYKDTGQQAWTPPPGWRSGAPPIDPQLADDLGVPRDLGQAQEGAEGGSGSGAPESGT